MNHRVHTNVEWHAFFTPGKGAFGGVARYCGTGKIREWGPPIPSIFRIWLIMILMTRSAPTIGYQTRTIIPIKLFI